MPAKNPENPRVFLVHRETALGEFVLIDPLRFRSVGLVADLTSRCAVRTSNVETTSPLGVLTHAKGEVDLCFYPSVFIGKSAHRGDEKAL